MAITRSKLNLQTAFNNLNQYKYNRKNLRMKQEALKSKTDKLLSYNLF